MFAEHPFWRYPLFQIPALLAVIFAILAILSSFIGWFTPSVSVQLGIDLSESTYAGSTFMDPKSVMFAELFAVKELARRNDNLTQAATISVSGFASQVVPITDNFTSQSSEVEAAIDRVVQPSLKSRIGGGTNLDAVVRDGSTRLATQVGRCKEMVVVTDGAANLTSAVRDEAVAQSVRLNFLIVNTQFPDNLRQDAEYTRGKAYLASDPNGISSLLAGDFFESVRFNPFVPIFWCLSWIAFMWSLLLPAKAFLRKHMSLRPDVASRIPAFNALFWTFITPLLLFVFGTFQTFGSC